MSTSFAELAERYLYRRDNTINPTLDNTRALLSVVGEPQRRLSSVQITGTNGKSSVAWMVGAILRAAGLSSGVYTSPHLISFTERLTIDGAALSEQELAAALAELSPHIDRMDALDGSGGVSGFELLTVAALKVMAERGVDVAVLEVGMGGRWDATSEVLPKVSVITGVDVDHTEYLGDTREQIAAEKAHIIKDGSTALLGPGQPHEVVEVVDERCAAVGASLLILSKSSPSEFTLASAGANGALIEREFDNDRQGGGRSEVDHYATGVRGRVTIRSRRSVYRDICVAGEASYSASLTALAVCAAEEFLDAPLDAAAVSDALAALRLPGRFELIPGSPSLLLDGAHNPDAARQLARSIKQLTEHPMTLVIGCMRDKDISSMLDALLPLADRVIATSVDDPRALPAAELLQLIEGRKADALAVPGVSAALGVAIDAAEAEDLICVTGSLYTVGAAKALLESNASSLSAGYSSAPRSTAE